MISMISGSINNLTFDAFFQVEATPYFDQDTVPYQCSRSTCSVASITVRCMHGVFIIIYHSTISITDTCKQVINIDFDTQIQMSMTYENCYSLSMLRINHVNLHTNQTCQTNQHDQHDQSKYLLWCQLLQLYILCDLYHFLLMIINLKHCYQLFRNMLNITVVCQWG